MLEQYYIHLNIKVFLIKYYSPLVVTLQCNINTNYVDTR